MVFRKVEWGRWWWGDWSSLNLKIPNWVCLRSSFLRLPQYRLGRGVVGLVLTYLILFDGTNHGSLLGRWNCSLLFPMVGPNSNSFESCVLKLFLQGLRLHLRASPRQPRASGERVQRRGPRGRVRAVAGTTPGPQGRKRKAQKAAFPLPKTAASHFSTRYIFVLSSYSHGKAFLNPWKPSTHLWALWPEGPIVQHLNFPS